MKRFKYCSDCCSSSNITQLSWNTNKFTHRRKKNFYFLEGNALQYWNNFKKFNIKFNKSGLFSCTTMCLLSTVYCQWSTVCCLMSTVYSLLSMIYWLIPFTKQNLHNNQPFHHCVPLWTWLCALATFPTTRRYKIEPRSLTCSLILPDLSINWVVWDYKSPTTRREFIELVPS